MTIDTGVMRNGAGALRIQGDGATASNVSHQRGAPTPNLIARIAVRVQLAPSQAPGSYTATVTYTMLSL